MTQARQASAALFGTVALLIAASLFIIGMNDSSLWTDDVLIYQAADLITSLRALYDLDAHIARITSPPFFHIQLKAWMLLTGESDYAMRVLVAFHAMLAAACIYRLGADLTGRAEGGLSGVIVFAAAAYVADYAHALHAYTLMLTLISGLMLCFWRWWWRPTWLTAAGIVGLSALIMFTHYYAAFFLLALNGYALAAALLTGRNPLLFIGLQAGAALLYLPWLPPVIWLARGGFRSSTEFATLAANTRPINLDTLAFYVRHWLFDGVGWHIGVLAVALAGIALRPIPPRREQGRVIGWLLTVFALSWALAMAGSVALQFNVPRHLIFLFIPFALLIGYGLAHWPPWVRYPLLLAYVLLTPFQPTPDGLVGDLRYRDAIAHIAENAQPGDAVFVNMTTTLERRPLDFYAARMLPPDVPYVLLTDEVAHIQYSLWPRQRLWMLYAGRPSLANWFPPLDAKGFTTTERHTFARTELELLAAEPAPPLPQLANTDAHAFASGVSLTGWQVDVRGEAIDVGLRWHTDAPLSADYAVFLHLLGGDGALIATGDSTPTHHGEPLPTRYWPTRVPIADARRVTAPEPGTYRLRVGLYDRASGARLPIGGGDSIDLGTVTVGG